VKPLDWLRRQTKPMTPEQQNRFLQVCEAVDANIRNARLAPAQLAPPIGDMPTRHVLPPPAARDEPAPTGFIRIDHTLTDVEAEQVRQRFQTALTRKPSADSSCDCWPQYIDCCCDVRKHTQRQ